MNQKNEPFISKRINTEGSYYDDKPPYHAYIRTINYGGDGDFTGVDEPKKQIKVTINDEITYVNHTDIGVSTNSALQVLGSSKRIYQSENDEATSIILSGYSQFPDNIKKIINSTKEYEASLSGMHIVRNYFKNIKNIDNKELDNIMESLTNFVNNEHKKTISTSPTVMAVHKMVEALDNMYQEAIPYYQK